ncbi:MAG: GumC family protein [Bdellovibrionales bacterium]
MEEIIIKDFLLALWRRRRLFVAVFGVVFLLSMFFAFRWSNYRSTATVEIALPEVADKVVNEKDGSSREAMADLRISYLQQKVLSTGSLVEIITKFNLYPGSRQKRPMADIANSMRQRISVNLVGSSSTGRYRNSTVSTIAFTLSFDYSNPLLAQQVTSELISRFLDEDIKQRQTQAKETTEFLAGQIENLEKSLKEQEKKIADFQAKYGDSRPDALSFNQSVMTSLMMNMQSLESQITSNLGSLGALQAQLASIDPYSRVVGENQVLTTPSIQLRAAQADYAALSAKYGPDHPDVVKARRQMQSLEKYAKGQGKIATVQALIDDVTARLSSAQKTKGAENPDVVSLKNQLSSLRKQLADEVSKPASFVKKDADNPAYLSVVAQMQAAQERGRALETQKKALQEQVDKYQKAVVENPEAEKIMAELSRDYANAQERYRQLQAMKMEAEMKETIEKNRAGQRLQIINPPELPTSTQPSRKMLLLAGLLFSIAAGCTTIIGIQLISGSVIGAGQLEALVGVAPLIVIPHIVTKDEKIKVTRRHVQMAIAVVAVVVVGTILVSYLVMPLDVLVSVIAMRLGLY